MVITLYDVLFGVELEDIAAWLDRKPATNTVGRPDNSGACLLHTYVAECLAQRYGADHGISISMYQSHYTLYRPTHGVHDYALNGDMSLLSSRFDQLCNNADLLDDNYARVEQATELVAHLIAETTSFGKTSACPDAY